ncbi:hypothetical protein QAD02_014248 [Eretmocerus hayati]|uniref:Uncharacterized protein n=1 Tax=Eretmocerus hayati TaxID=131215 RepID=A0ACC2P6G6_9HYME|nr:hypothetical protein QAD02_014248 [Eretmocerus hayati]
MLLRRRFNKAWQLRCSSRRSQPQLAPAAGSPRVNPIEGNMTWDKLSPRSRKHADSSRDCMTKASHDELQAITRKRGGRTDAVNYNLIWGIRQWRTTISSDWRQ